MIQAEIITPWINMGDEVEGDFYPQLREDYSLAWWQDVTGQEESFPDPNSYTVQIHCEKPVFDQIDLDNTYFVHWFEDIPAADTFPGIRKAGNKDELYEPNAWGKMRSYLAQQGFSQAWIDANTDQELSRGENANLLKEAMRELK